MEIYWVSQWSLEVNDTYLNIKDPDAYLNIKDPEVKDTCLILFHLVFPKLIDSGKLLMS